MTRTTIVLLAIGGAAAVATAGPPTLSAADRAAAYKAAGFKQAGDRWIRCEEEPPTASYAPGALEAVDLNGDGRPEAWITESSLFCYGAAGSAVVLVAREENGSWRKLLDEIGVHLVLPARHQGWPDVEVGGPGMGKQPVFRWNGSTYRRR